MKTAFKILPQLQQEDPYHLIVEVGWDVVSLVYFSREPLCMESLYVYHVEKDSSAQQLATQIAEVFENESLPKHTSCHLCYNFKECTLLPSKYLREENLADILNLLHGETSGSANLFEKINGAEMVVAHRVDESIKTVISQQFPGCRVHHALALQLPILMQTDALYCTVYQHSIKVVLIKGNELQIARYFEYTTPSDVAYHLLNVCTQHEFSPETGRLLLSGFIDQKSNLYDELYRYFLNIELAEGDKSVTCTQVVSQYPGHFFSPLTLLASCVS